eukprot:350709-Chlamydomonas_euryale.AAC.1
MKAAECAEVHAHAPPCRLTHVRKCMPMRRHAGCRMRGSACECVAMHVSTSTQNGMHATHACAVIAMHAASVCGHIAIRAERVGRTMPCILPGDQAIMDRIMQHAC